VNKRRWLIKLRNSQNLTQEEVARRVKIDRTSYTKIENGGALSVKVAKRIGEELGFQWSIFFDEDCAKNALGTKLA
jgi:transcriptional regulator with XRE-family HTH domain